MHQAAAAAAAVNLLRTAQLAASAAAASIAQSQPPETNSSANAHHPDHQSISLGRNKAANEGEELLDVCKFPRIDSKSRELIFKHEIISMGILKSWNRSNFLMSVTCEVQTTYVFCKLHKCVWQKPKKASF